MVHGKFKAQFVERFGCHAGLDDINHHVEGFCCEFASLAHGREIFRAMQLNLARLAAGGFGRVYEIHVTSMGLEARTGGAQEMESNLSKRASCASPDYDLSGFWRPAYGRNRPGQENTPVLKAVRSPNLGPSDAKINRQ
jgi:hypothetical protein